MRRRSFLGLLAAAPLLPLLPATTAPAFNPYVTKLGTAALISGQTPYLTAAYPIRTALGVAARIDGSAPFATAASIGAETADFGPLEAAISNGGGPEAVAPNSAT